MDRYLDTNVKNVGNNLVTRNCIADIWNKTNVNIVMLKYAASGDGWRIKSQRGKEEGKEEGKKKTLKQDWPILQYKVEQYIRLDLHRTWENGSSPIVLLWFCTCSCNWADVPPIKTLLQNLCKTICNHGNNPRIFISNHLPKRVVRLQLWISHCNKEQGVWAEL